MKFKFGEEVWLGFHNYSTWQPFIYVGIGESGGTIYYFRQATEEPNFTMPIMESAEYLLSYRDSELQPNGQRFFNGKTIRLFNIV